MKARIEASFHQLDPTGRVAAECWSDYKTKLETWHAHRADFEAALQDWPTVRAQLRSLVKPPQVASNILQAVSSPVRFAELTPIPTESGCPICISMCSANSESFHIRRSTCVSKLGSGNLVDRGE